MNISRVILVTGHPGSGKTTLAKRLSSQFELPFICRDAIKEVLFDSLGWSDRAWSRKIGMASYDLMDHMVNEELNAHHSFIIESNFDPNMSNAKYQKLQSKYHFKSLQILCDADDDVLVKRFIGRDSSGNRHPGHVDQTNYVTLEDRLREGKLLPLDIEGEVIRYDTTNLNALDTETVEKAVRQLLS